MSPPPLQILVTNDDGVDSMGLHVLARAMRPFGRVTVVAPDHEFSGAGAAIGAIWEEHPEVHDAHIDGIDKVWTVSGPPALCVMYAHLGAFEFHPDLIVSGINPGANVGRSVYHSGTIGAALTGRNYGIPGVAVSQAVDNSGVEGQAWGDVVANLPWDTAASVTQRVVDAMVNTMADHYEPGRSPVLNINVPDLAFDQLEGWRWTSVGTAPRRAMTTVHLTPKAGHVGSYSVRFDYGDAVDPERGTDTATVIDGLVSISSLSQITANDDTPTLVGKAVSKGLDDLLA
jgi:5'-nucleotidase